MQIKIDQNDIEKVLKEFCPAVQYVDGKLRITIESGKTNQNNKAPEKKFLDIEDMVIAAKSKVNYGTISGDLDLKLDLKPDGIDGMITIQ